MQYEYECPKCLRRITLEQKMTERSNPICGTEGCENVFMESVIGAPMFILKGSGWAKDGYSK